MNRQELIEAMAAKTGSTKADVDRATAGLIAATHAPLKIKASKAPEFKAGATLKSAVNGAKK